MSNLTELQKPFQAYEHEFNYEDWAYISEHAITTRLDTVLGIDGWQLKQTDIRQVTATHWVAVVELSIKTDNGWITRSGTGEGTTAINKPKKDGSDPLEDPRYVTNMGENAAKGAVTDAFRRAARLFGIGRYLLNLPKDKYGKPEVTNENELRGWLIDNYMKPDPKPPTPPDNTPPPAPPVEEPPAPEAIAPPPKKQDPRQELDGKSVNVIKFEHVPVGLNKRPYFVARFDYDEIPLSGTEIRFYEDNGWVIDDMYGRERGNTAKKVKELGNVDLDVPLVLRLYCDKKTNILKPADTVLQDMTMKNPALQRSFLKQYPHLNNADITKALKVETIEDYTGDVRQAHEAVQAYEQALEDELKAKAAQPRNVTELNAYTQKPLITTPVHQRAER